jgi:hypothetical protein
MSPSKPECLMNDTKKVFHLQICDSLLIHLKILTYNKNRFFPDENIVLEVGNDHCGITVFPPEVKPS